MLLIIIFIKDYLIWSRLRYAYYSNVTIFPLQESK